MTQFPDDFRTLVSETLGDTEYQQLAEALAMPAPTSIRINPRKTTRAELEQMLDGAEAVEWCADGFHLRERPQFTFDPLMHCGCYYVQEAASMSVGRIIRHFIDTEEPGDTESRRVVALDACAAPGGKSTLALDSLPEDSLLVANEYVRQRAGILVENLMKWGNPNIIVTNSDTRDFTQLAGLFDIIICDAPCSGEGMFRKDPKAIHEWSLDNVATCQMRQREIVRNLWPALKTGGLFIYSTCTFNHLEDEDNVQWMQHELGARPLPLPSPLPGSHFYPHRTKGEGFFVATFTKDSDGEHPETRPRKPKKAARDVKKQGKTPEEVTKWLADADKFAITQSADGTFNAFPYIYNNVLEQVHNAVRIVHHGIQLAEAKGGKIQPCHSLAVSDSLNLQAFHIEEVDYPTALQYLRGEAIRLASDCPKGIVVIAYRGHTLGFAKNIGNRANNLYPSEWRIRTTHLPDSTLR